MSERLTLDVNLAMADQVGTTGLRRGDLEALAPRVKAIHQTVANARQAGQLPFLDLPSDANAAGAAKQLGEVLAKDFEDVLVLGIGGSSLGAKALFAALCHPLHNLLPRGKRQKKGARLFFPDNADPATFGAILDVVDLGKTAIVPITKSGGTAETWAQLLYLREQLTSRGLDEKRHIVAVTDPQMGALRKVATERGWRTLPVPPGVGGRFSVLTAVGLLPAAAAGIDVDSLLTGAAEMVERCQSADLFSNPAYLFASTLYLMDTMKRRPIHVFMPYADALRETADWFVQLWAESLGKRAGGNGKPAAGPTPIRAVGATDQHSLLQLLMEGPQDKLTAFVTLNRPRVDFPIPAGIQEPDVGYLGGHSFHDLLSAEQRATAAALASTGRPSLTIRLPALDAKSLGELLMMLEIATAFAGGLYEVNPYDQPGVEAGKRYACGLLGRPGYEGARTELEGRPPARSEWVL